MYAIRSYYVALHLARVFLGAQVDRRITSYNVCYTKLLRGMTDELEIMLGIVREKSLYPDRILFQIIDDDESVLYLPEYRIHICRNSKYEPRITSYNVCYTKLLRMWHGTDGSLRLSADSFSDWLLAKCRAARRCFSKAQWNSSYNFV